MILRVGRFPRPEVSLPRFGSSQQRNPTLGKEAAGRGNQNRALARPAGSEVVDKSERILMTDGCSTWRPCRPQPPAGSNRADGLGEAGGGENSKGGRGRLRRPLPPLTSIPLSAQFLCTETRDSGGEGVGGEDEGLRRRCAWGLEMPDDTMRVRFPLDWFTTFRVRSRDQDRGRRRRARLRSRFGSRSRSRRGLPRAGGSARLPYRPSERRRSAPAE